MTSSSQFFADVVSTTSALVNSIGAWGWVMIGFALGFFALALIFSAITKAGRRALK